MKYSKERKEVAYMMRRLYGEGLTTVSGGNISLRINAEKAALTGSGYDKRYLKPSQVGILDLNGENRTPKVKPTIESSLHLEIYKRYPDIQAVVHAHPPSASVFCLNGTPLNTAILSESYAFCGVPVTASYATMGTKELADHTATACADGVCVLMEFHGTLTYGKDLSEAFSRTQVLEKTAEIQLKAAALENPGTSIPQDKLALIDRLMGRKS